MTLLGYTPTNQDVINAIRNMAQRKKQIIHGARSVNIQLPKTLRRKTKDYDVYTKKPEQSARELAEQLNKKFGKDKFKVVKGVHKGTFKVKEGKETIADYTQVTKQPASKNIFGIRYTTKEYSKRKLQKILRDESKSFRHDKDLDTLQRIKQGERIWD